MDRREFAEWQAYERLNGPIGELRQDWRFASLEALLANVNRGKGQRAWRIEDFLLKFHNRSAGPMSNREIMARIKMALGGKRGGSR
jgi:hypothetical protein